MRKGSSGPKLKLSIPSSESPVSRFLSHSGTFRDGDLLVNKDGVRILSQNEDIPQLVVSYLYPMNKAPAFAVFGESSWEAALPPLVKRLIPELVPTLIKPSDNQLTLADIDVIKVIGRGNGGIVQLVRHKWTAQFFALKVIQMNIQEPIRKQIAQELKINQSAQCPYVVVYYQSFYDNGVISIVLEYMDGGSLADFLKKVKTIPEPFLAVISKQVLMGLLYLHHDKHIIHRDVKPSNLLINHTGAVKITDFGVSTIKETTSGLANTFVGTYNYMSPERISGGVYGYKSDIWCLGLVLLECATGKFPYSSPKEEGWDNFYELMEAVVDQPPPCAPSDQFSPEFCSFISACLQKDPKDRQSARELMEHPFISMYEDSNVDLAAYFTNAGSPLATF